LTIIIGNTTIEVLADASDCKVIQDKTPVVTGNLRRGFVPNAEGNIDNAVPYCDYVELGTSRFPGRYMITQSLGELGRRMTNKVIDKMQNIKIIPDMEITISATRQGYGV
jgi:hypothetical protein